MRDALFIRCSNSAIYVSYKVYLLPSLKNNRMGDLLQKARNAAYEAPGALPITKSTKSGTTIREAALLIRPLLRAFCNRRRKEPSECTRILSPVNEA
jgi:hypothetical protein